MNHRTTEDIISALYDTIQDARSMPLSSDKCIIERDRVVDMLDEIIAQLPAALKQSRTIVESRNELISQARREAESIIRQAHEQAQQMVSQEAIYNEAKRLSEALAMQTQNRMAQIQRAGYTYMDETLRQSEETIMKALEDIRDTRMKFHAVIEAQNPQNPQPEAQQ